MIPRSNRARYFASLGAGALVAFSLPPWGWWPLAFIGVAVFARLTMQVGTRSCTQFWLGTAFALAGLRRECVGCGFSHHPDT